MEVKTDLSLNKMEEAQHLLEKLHIHRQVQFDNDLQTLVDTITYNEQLKKETNKILEDSKKDSVVFENSMNHIKNVLEDVKKKAYFKSSHYRDLLGVFDNSESFNRFLNFNTTEEENEKLINFFHLYFLKKYSERNYYLCLHSNLFRSITYGYLHVNDFKQVEGQTFLLLQIFVSIISFACLKNETSNGKNAKCENEDLLNVIHSELNCVKEHISISKTSVEEIVPVINVVKYAFFVMEILCKKNDYYNNADVLYGMCLCMSNLINICLTCSSCFDNGKIEEYVKKDKEQSIMYTEKQKNETTTSNNSTNDTSEIGNESESKKNVNSDIMLNSDVSRNSNIIYYFYQYLKKFTTETFGMLNQKLLFYISKKKLNECTYREKYELLKNFNIAKFTTYIQQLFFTELTMNNGIKDIHLDFFSSLYQELFKQIISPNNCVEKMSLQIQQGAEKFQFEKIDELQKVVITHKEEQKRLERERKKKNQKKITERKVETNGNTSIEKTKKEETEMDANECKTNERQSEERLICKIFDETGIKERMVELHEALFEAQFKINEEFFEKHKMKNEKEKSMNELLDVSKLPQNTNEQITRFNNLMNETGKEHTNDFPCIDYFYYIGLDFDKTITNKDSYGLMYQILMDLQNYIPEDISNISLTEQDIEFFNSINHDIVINKDRTFTKEEKFEFLNKVNKWFLFSESQIVEMLKKKEEVSDVFSDSFNKYLKLIDNLHIKYSLLISYYDVLKGVSLNELNGEIDKRHKNLPLNDYFLEFFLNLIIYKNQNTKSFFFDLITLNSKKEFFISLIHNNLAELDQIYADELVQSNNKPKNKQQECVEKNHVNKEHITDKEESKQNKNYYRTFKQFFNIYYASCFPKDKEKRIYTGELKEDTNTIYYKHYTNKDITEQVPFFSLYNKKDIQKKVCSIINSNKLTCFVGDSLYDLPVLLNVDVPIVIGYNELLVLFCQKHNITIKPLILAAAKIEMIAKKNSSKGTTTTTTCAYGTCQNKWTENSVNANSVSKGTCNNHKNINSEMYQNLVEQKCEVSNNISANFHSLSDNKINELSSIFDEGKKTLYSVESWLEIGIFFFGKNFY